MIAIHTVSLIEGFFFSAAAAYALGFFYFRTVGAATIAGLAYGFAGYRMGQFSHVQLVHGEFLPLMILAFEKVLDRGGRRWPCVLGLATLGQWLTSWYWAVFSMWVAGPYVAWRLWARRAELTRERLIGVAAPLMVAVVLTLPFAQPYVKLKSRNVLYRPADAMQGMATRALDFVHPNERSMLYGTLASGGEGAGSERDGFPGIVVIAGMVFVSVYWRKRDDACAAGKRRPFPKGLWLAITAMLLVFSFGSSLSFSADADAVSIPLPYALVERFFPFAGSMRVPARWMLPALLGMALLTAWSWETVQSVLGARKSAWVGIALGVALFGECLTRPARYVEVDGARYTVFDWLKEQPFPAPVVEVPYRGEMDNTAMMRASWHRQPLMGGSNGFFPPGYPSFLNKLEAFPDEATIEELRTKYRTRFILYDTALVDAETARDAKETAKRGGVVIEFGRYFVVDLLPEGINLP